MAYCEYFNINDAYFSQVNDSTIASARPDFWMRTYPHKTFIEMLNSMERVLSQKEKRSLWIEGAYGTGKSLCAYTLKRILEVPEEELLAYWDMYEPLKKEVDLLSRLKGHKSRGGGIVTAYRYASGMITSPRDLFFAVQESLKASLLKANLYAGENTLKESVIAWIDEPTRKQFFEELLKKPEWAATFSQNSADEVLYALRKGKNIESLMDNIFRLADKEGITALNIDADRLIAWLTDVIDQNDMKIVFIWDEFSDYFKNNKESLSEFQKLAELVNHKPFYFVVVTHESGQLFTQNDTSWVRVRDRFVSVNIDLPNNIAFELIGHAFSVKPAAKEGWDKLADDLNSRVNTSRSKVMKTAKISNPQVMKDIMPIHPMAALFLRSIASAFKSNQRSMFDFIEASNGDDVKAFQWFIENRGPYDDHPLLTVDMLWNFFYEKGRDNLTTDIRLILDTFSQQQNLSEDEKTVLKAILIMQAISQRERQIEDDDSDLIRPTEQNLSYVFEGISDLEGTKSGNIAKGLKSKGILVSNPLSGGRYVYAAAILAGDQTRIDSFKEQIRNSSTTAKLAAEGELETALPLSPALRLRFESEPGTGKIRAVTAADFTRIINTLSNKQTGWNFNAVIAFAKDDMEAAAFRRTLRNAVADKQYENIIFIDALSTPLGHEAFERYLELSAMSMYYQSNQNTASRENADKAKRVLDQEWKNNIYNGQFLVYTYSNQGGEKVSNGQGVASVLQSIVANKFPYAFDFAKNLTESQLKTTAMKQSAKSGITQSTSGVVNGLEKHVLPSVWERAEYWKDLATASLPISKIKAEVDRQIELAFDKAGHIPIGEIYDFLEKSYGFAPCNLSAFLVGFLLKEYAGAPYRYSDSSGGHEEMTQDKLAEMIGNYIGKSPKPTYIVKMTPEEKAFYELTEKAWGIKADSCSSAGKAAQAVTSKMQDLALPVWCLEEVDTLGIYDIVQKYIEFVQKEGSEAHNKAIEIGRIALNKPSLAINLPNLIKSGNCQKGMLEYLRSFEGGRLLDLAEAIGAQDDILKDIKRLYSVKYSCLWDKQTGESEIRKLLVEYGIVKATNSILNTAAHSLGEAYKEWREHLNFIGISFEALQSAYPPLAAVLDMLLKIYNEDEILVEQLKDLHQGLIEHSAKLTELLNNDLQLFYEVYNPYLEDFSEEDITKINANVGRGLFGVKRIDSNISVRNAAENYKKEQLVTQLLSLWKQKTGTKNPNEWSNLYKTPILCLVQPIEFEKAKKAFDTLNRNDRTDGEINAALAYLKETTLFNLLHDNDKRDEAFKKDILGIYSTLLTDINKVRDKLSNLQVEVYNWRGNPEVQNRIKQLAKAEYDAGGSNKVLSKIDNMSDAQLKEYLKLLIKDNVTVGLEILRDRG